MKAPASPARTGRVNLYAEVRGLVRVDGDIKGFTPATVEELHPGLHWVSAEYDGYASDITRTMPVSGRFDTRQREIYDIVLGALTTATAAMKPGISFRDVHFIACREIATGLKDLGIMKGDVDEAVAAGAHAICMPHGLGHMMGLDVHDMENLGEDFVGYTDTIKRSTQFGRHKLRLARKLEPGFVLTVEPGIYFISQLMAQWKASGKFDAFVDFKKVETYMGFGGVRIEDDVLVTSDGCEVLSRSAPKVPAAIEAVMRRQ